MLFLSLDREDLATVVVAAGIANDVGWFAAAALATFAKLRGMPAIGRTAGAQAHFRCFTFWDSHMNS